MIPEKRAPHPVVWTILYLPFGAFGGFVTVALTFLATKKGLSISEGALLNGAQMLIQWLKWLWAPAVDVTLTPRKWYVLSTSLSACAILTMAAIPLGPSTLGVLLVVIAAASLVNSVVGMAIEAMISACTPPKDAGRVSAWFQAGNLGGAGLGGALGLLLVTTLPSPWMAGAIMGALFLSCCAALRFTPNVAAPHKGKGARVAVTGVVGDLGKMLKTKGGLLSAILCVMPIGTGAAQVVLTQGKVAQFWGAGEHEVELLQGLLAGLVTTVGCFVGGALCQRVRPRTAYAAIGVLLAAIAVGMAACPATVTMYVVWSMIYSFGVGLAYAAFTAVVIHAMGHGSGATKYNIFASLSNFPIWWLGLVLGLAAQKWGPRAMLLTEAGFGGVGVLVVLLANKLVGRTKLPESVPEPADSAAAPAV